ncbi:MAG: type IV secretion system protein VirJ [Sphingopyxis sp.]|nr:type IV secretion system protein VirJ [Sphingopyxis sp.]
MKRWLALLSVVLAGAAIFYGHAGYYNGAVFRDMPSVGSRPERPAVVILSGDMGNRVGMTPQVAGRLNSSGYAVVTVNSLTYFSPRRTAKEAAGLIEAAMRRAMELGRTDSVVLIGQSFGADMLHAGLADMPKEKRRPIRAVILVVPGNDIVFRASPVELAGIETPDQRAYPTASQLRWIPVTCIQGIEESASLCPELRMPNVRRVALPGGHKLRSDDAALTAAILQSFPEPKNPKEPMR